MDATIQTAPSPTTARLATRIRAIAAAAPTLEINRSRQGDRLTPSLNKLAIRACMAMGL
jgi:hypothetical protein